MKPLRKQALSFIEALYLFRIFGIYIPAVNVLVSMSIDLFNDLPVHASRLIRDFAGQAAIGTFFYACALTLLYGKDLVIKQLSKKKIDRHVHPGD